MEDAPKPAPNGSICRQPVTETDTPKRVMLGEPYIRDPNWQPGPMAGPGHHYPDVWAKKKRGKR